VNNISCKQPASLFEIGASAVFKRPRNATDDAYACFIKFISGYIRIYRARHVGNVIQDNCEHAGGARHFYDAFLARYTAQFPTFFNKPRDGLFIKDIRPDATAINIYIN
jgi:hypothetical protein